MLGKKLVTAQKRGETRALCLGLGMVACSVMMYFLIGITIMPSYRSSVWTKTSVCKLLKANIKDKVHCSYNYGSGEENIFRYPCLEVWVNLTVSGQVMMLYHTEGTLEQNPKCSYIPGKLEDYEEVKKQVTTVTENFRKHPTFPCYYDPEENKQSVILERLYSLESLLFAFLWPTLMLVGGVLIVIMVKTSQYLSVLSASQHKTNI
uniref:Potassium calcium-activated channel subfamily M regulatory beta subunit 1 n=1 Tax=Sphenodon punctatus TaxID=8508 RepID=A0A8D0GT43_SPHPU